MSIILTAICATPLLVNMSKLPINSHDLEVFDRMRVSHKCDTFVPGKPCMKKLVKVGFQDYKVICAKAS